MVLNGKRNMRHTQEDKLLKQYLLYCYGKHVAKLWIKYPKFELFKLLSCLNNPRCDKKIMEAIKNDDDYVIRAVFNKKLPFTIDYSLRVKMLREGK